jgi:hypothetical protein
MLGGCTRAKAGSQQHRVRAKMRSEIRSEMRAEVAITYGMRI